MSQPFSSPITRRQALAGMAANTAGPWLLNWPNVALGDQQSAQSAGYAIYVVVPKGNGWQKLSQRFGTASLATTCGGKPAVGLLAWLKAAEAAELKTSSDVEAVNQVAGDTIVQKGDAKKSGGKVAMQIGPGDWPKPPAAGTFRTREQIASQWKTRIGGLPGVSVELLPSEPIPPGSLQKMRTNAPGQIQVTFPGDECPAEILRLIKSEPQVYHIQWGGPLVLFHCPPCGLG